MIKNFLLDITIGIGLVFLFCKKIIKKIFRGRGPN